MFQTRRKIADLSRFRSGCGNFGLGPKPSFFKCRDDFPRHRFHAVLRRPIRIVGLEPTEVANVPDMISGPRGLGERPSHLAAGQRLAEVDRFEDRAIGIGAAAHIVDLAPSRGLEDGPKGRGAIVAVKIVPDLLPLVAEDRIGRAGDRAPC